MQACRLSVTDLACRRGERVLFRGIGFALDPGAALQIAGINGSGKSSLLRIVAGLLPAFVGAVELAGPVGLVDERPALDPHLPLDKALGFWRQLDHGAETAARLGLSGLDEVPVRYLSTGQKKRAAFARLLGQQAPVWLLDEPLNGLDTKGAALVEELAASHCADGGICLVASHQPFRLKGMERIDLADFAA